MMNIAIALSLWIHSNQVAIEFSPSFPDNIRKPLSAREPLFV